jgi:hypothetical protein
VVLDERRKVIMELATIEMPVEEAKARLVHYERMLASERTDQDRRIARGYKTLARGMPIIELTKSIATGGFHDSGLPRIAIARADAKDCWVEHESWPEPGAFVFSTEAPRWSRTLNRGALVNSRTVRVRITPEMDIPNRWSRGGHTIMPIIPPNLRPRRNRLHLFHILWEVEEWKNLVVPRDPALVRWISGDLWEVTATWDLTELERAVLAR